MEGWNSDFQPAVAYPPILRAACFRCKSQLDTRNNGGYGPPSSPRYRSSHQGDPAQLIGSLPWPGLGWTFAIHCRGGCLAQAVEVWAFGARPRFPLQPPQG